MVLSPGGLLGDGDILYGKYGVYRCELKCFGLSGNVKYSMWGYL